MNFSTLKRIAIVGPECTGKSDLAHYLAQYFKTQWVPEYAREYIDTLKRPYEKYDLSVIAKGQLALEDKLATHANTILICDTTLLVIKIWSEFKYGSCSSDILTQIENRQYDLHLLTYIDIPWEDDPQREHPQQRQQLYLLYKAELEKMSVPFVEIKGEQAQRRETAIDAIHKILK